MSGSLPIYSSVLPQLPSFTVFNCFEVKDDGKNLNSSAPRPQGWQSHKYFVLYIRNYEK